MNYNVDLAYTVEHADGEMSYTGTGHQLRAADGGHGRLRATR